MPKIEKIAQAVAESINEITLKLKPLDEVVFAVFARTSWGGYWHIELPYRGEGETYEDAAQKKLMNRMWKW